jgi:sialate O-acetylesterase
MKSTVLFLTVATLLVTAAHGAEVASVFTDHMVLQQRMPVSIWGTGSPGETVTVKFAGQQRSTKTGKDGTWSLKLRSLKASATPQTLTITSPTGERTISDVLVGEVWLASGQSNMEWTLAKTVNSSNTIANASDNLLRLFTVEKKVSDQPQSKVTGTWTACTPATASRFSAVGYFFGRDLRSARRVPVGIICGAWGGTPAQAWTSRGALEANPLLKRRVTNHDDPIANFNHAKAEADFQTALAQYQVAVTNATATGQKPPPKPVKAHPPTSNQNCPYRLYNGMIAPLVPFTFRGVIWYQGEGDNKLANEYRTLFPTLIKDWRRAFGHEFPFLFVQITPFFGMTPEIRDAQLFAWRTVPKTAMVVTTDYGNANDIHPRNKEPVGARLALAARAIAYGEKIEYSGPLFDKLKVDGDRAILSFQHVGDGLVAHGETLTGFEISDGGTNFVPATATIKGNTVVVTSDTVKSPVAVRFGWANVPEVNLFNKNGLPATPFRTDNK